MYNPSTFAETDQRKLHEFIELHGFATLLLQTSDELTASHIPLLLDRDSGPHGCLIGHMAKANSQWTQADGRKSLAIFHGPHAYISPTWYESVNVVPTWNYVAVHVSGTFRLDDTRSRRLEIVSQFVDYYESTMESPWSLHDQDVHYIDRLLDAIVGFRIDIEHLEGKWKLNQNHDSERRIKVAQALREAGGEDRLEIANMMTQTRESPS